MHIGLWQGFIILSPLTTTSLPEPVILLRDSYQRGLTRIPGSDSHIECQGRHYFLDFVGLMGPYEVIVTHYGTMDPPRDYFIICTDDNMINRANDSRTKYPTNEDRNRGHCSIILSFVRVGLSFTHTSQFSVTYSHTAQ